MLMLRVCRASISPHHNPVATSQVPPRSSTTLVYSCPSVQKLGPICKEPEFLAVELENRRITCRYLVLSCLLTLSRKLIPTLKNSKLLSVWMVDPQPKDSQAAKPSFYS